MIPKQNMRGPWTCGVLSNTIYPFISEMNQSGIVCAAVVVEQEVFARDWEAQRRLRKQSVYSDSVESRESRECRTAKPQRSGFVRRMQYV